MEQIVDVYQQAVQRIHTAPHVQAALMRWYFTHSHNEHKKLTYIA